MQQHNRLRKRHNLLERASELWKPPNFAPLKTRRQRMLHAARCFLDLQAGTLWRDLSTELPLLRGRVLDVGCGAQPFRTLLHPSAQYVGIDTADAKAHFGYEMPDTLYFAGGVWPIANGSVDAILCTETLEHVPEPREFLAEAARCLRPRGQLILTVPFAARWHYIPYDYWRFTPSGLQRLLDGAGFGKVAVYARGNEVTVACYKVMALLLPLLFPQGRGGPAAWALRAIGVLCLPLLVLLALIANLSLGTGGGDDCLGYTVLAERNP